MLINIKEFIEDKPSIKRLYKGIVVDNKDPLKQSRVKVVIPNFLVGDTASLPWINKQGDSFLGGSTESGKVNVPLLGSELTVEFPFDDVYFGFYTSYWTTTQNKVSDFDGQYDDIVGTKIQDLFYSYNRNSKLLNLTHPSGLTLEIDSNGNLTINGANNINANCVNANVVAQQQINTQSQIANVTSPLLNIEAVTGVNMTTPLLNVSGLISCGGIGAGAPPVAGKGVFQGDVETQGDVSTSQTSINTIRTTFNTHTHPENGDGGGTTSPPNQPL